MGSHTHWLAKCRIHGHVLAQCRCPRKKAERLVDCTPACPGIREPAAPSPEGDAPICPHCDELAEDCGCADLPDEVWVHPDTEAWSQAHPDDSARRDFTATDGDYGGVRYVRSRPSEAEPEGDAPTLHVDTFRMFDEDGFRVRLKLHGKVVLTSPREIDALEDAEGVRDKLIAALRFTPPVQGTLREPDYWSVVEEDSEEGAHLVTRSEAEAFASDERRRLLKEWAEAEGDAEYTGPEVTVTPVWVGDPLSGPVQGNALREALRADMETRVQSCIHEVQNREAGDIDSARSILASVYSKLFEARHRLRVLATTEGE